MKRSVSGPRPGRKTATAKRPVVAAHLAITADGKISTHRLTPSRFTSAADKRLLQEIRAGADAVMVGRGTLTADAMSLGLSAADLREARVARGRPPVPLRVIISNSGRLDPDAKAFSYPGSRLIILSTTRMPQALRPRILRHADLYLFPASGVDLREGFRILSEDFGVRRLVCEGGGALLRSLAELDLIDEIHLTVAPVIFGGLLAPTLTGLPGPFLSSPKEFRITQLAASGDECRLELRRRTGRRK